MSGVADRILTNGKIFLGLKDGFAEALAIAGDKVLATGSAEEIAALAGDDTQVIDLGGKLAVPGFNDVHMHLSLYGLGLKELDLSPKEVTSVEELLAKIGEKAAVAAPGDWIVGRGYDHSKLAEYRHPTKAELDAVAPDNPVYVVRTCGHVGVANSKALAAAGIGHNTPSPAGGLIERKDNELTGLLAENARFPVQQAMPEKTKADFVEAIDAGGRRMIAYGITSCMDAAVGGKYGMMEIEAYEEAKATGHLPLRVNLCLLGDITKSVIEEASAQGMVTGWGDEQLKIGPVKIFTDGSAGGHTAAMTLPYENSNECGLLCLTDEQCDTLVARAHDLGYQMAIHAIGDAAIDQVLNAYDKAQAANPAPDRRHRIEHCGWVRPDQIDRMVSLGVLPAPQPNFIYYFSDQYVKALGEERSDFCYPMRAFIDAGLEPSASTDAPVTPVTPFATIYGMVTRTSDKGTVVGGGQAISMAEAVHAYTYAAAYAVHEEEIKGRLVPGQLADIAVLSQDLFEIAPEAILETACEMTILGGEVVYEAEKAAA